MKRLMRALGVGAALLVPVAGLSFISTGTAGATTNPITFTVTFTFLGPTIHVTASCTTTRILLLLVNTPMKTITTWYKNQTMYKINCTSTGTVGHGVPATGTDVLLITPRGLLLSSTLNDLNFWPYTASNSTGVNFQLIFGTAECVVSFPTTVLFMKTRSVYKVTTVPTSGTNITAHTTTTGYCSSLATVLHTPTARFSGKATI